MPFTAAAPFDSAIGSTQTSVPIPREKTNVPKKVLRTAAKNDCCDEIVGERGIKKEAKTKKTNVHIVDALV